MDYESIKLEKGMYNVCNKSFTKVLEELDPSENYKGTYLEGLDAYQRQLKRFGIKVSGPGCDNLEKFFMSSESSVLFPEFISRSVKKGMESYDVLPSVVATKTIIDGLDYRTITSTVETPITGDPTIDEGSTLHGVSIYTNSSLVTLRKHGRLLSTTYEALRFQNLDVISIILRKIGSDLVTEELKSLVSLLTSITPITASSLTYTGLLQLWTAVKPYHMNVMLASYNTAKEILSLTEMRDAQAGLDFQGTGRDVTPIGARLICVPGMDDEKIIGLDRECSIQMIQSGDLIIDPDKLIDKQLNKAGISITSGFSRIFSGSVKILDYSED